jgi:hypothetical protein
MPAGIGGVPHVIGPEPICRQMVVRARHLEGPGGLALSTSDRPHLFAPVRTAGGCDGGRLGNQEVRELFPAAGPLDRGRPSSASSFAPGHGPALLGGLGASLARGPKRGRAGPRPPPGRRFACSCHPRPALGHLWPRREFPILVELSDRHHNPPGKPLAEPPRVLRSARYVRTAMPAGTV